MRTCSTCVFVCHALRRTLKLAGARGDSDFRRKRLKRTCRIQCQQTTRLSPENGIPLAKTGTTPADLSHQARSVTTQHMPTYSSTRQGHLWTYPLKFDKKMLQNLINSQLSFGDGMVVVSI